MFSSLNIKAFRIYWLGMFISLIGTWIQTVAQSWLVFQLTNSVFLLGLVGFLGSLPVFILSLFGGVLADRVNKKTILLFTQVAFMLLTFLLAVLTQMRLITPGQIILIAILNGIVMAFDAPSRQAVVVELVGKEYLLNAIALNSVAFNCSRIIGPALCGILVASIGMSGCFYINGISFLPLIIALLLIRINPVRNKTPEASVPPLAGISNGVNPTFKNAQNNSTLTDLKDGLRLIKNNRLILALVTIVAVSSLFGISYTILMPVFASDILNVGIKGLGVLMSASGIGALIAALVLARLGDFKYKGRLLILSSLIFSLSLVLFSLSKVYILSLINLILIGGSSVTAIGLINTILQIKVSDEFRGRVMSVFMFTFAGLMPFGNLIAGTISGVLGVSATVMLSGIISGACFIIVTVLYPDIKNI